MALTRKFLSAMGIDDDKAEQIISAHLETVGPLKQERDELKDKSEKSDEIQKELNSTKAELQKLKDSNGTDNWETKYNALVKEKEALQTEYDQYKADIASKELLEKKQTAYRELLAEQGVSAKRIDTVMKVSDMSAIELAEDGSIKDKNSHIATIKSEWADFIETQSTNGANVSTPPSGANENNKGTNVSGFTKSRAAVLAEQYHSNLYGENTKEGV